MKKRDPTLRETQDSLGAGSGNTSLAGKGDLEASAKAAAVNGGHKGDLAALNAIHDLLPTARELNQKRKKRSGKSEIWNFGGMQTRTG